VTYGNGLFVAVSSATNTNQVMTSPDGINWTVQTSAAANSWRSVTYGNGLFVAVSANGTNRVMTSPDGINWTEISVVTNVWTAITYGNGLFVAVAAASSNQIITSTDGINWTVGQAPEANGWASVTYGNGLFVAIASSGTNRIMYATYGDAIPIPTPTMTKTPSVTPTPTTSVTPSASNSILTLDLNGVPLNGDVGVYYNGILNATGGNGSYVYDIWLNSLPDGLSIDNNIISGIPSISGSFEIGFEVSDGSQTSQDIITINIT
jgi:hypothetical protein